METFYRVFVHLCMVLVVVIFIFFSKIFVIIVITLFKDEREDKVSIFLLVDYLSKFFISSRKNIDEKLSKSYQKIVELYYLKTI